MTDRPETIRLQKGHERRLLLGHLWVFSNEIANDLREYEPGSLVDVYAHGGSFIGRGYINPHSLIAVRLLSQRRETIDGAFFRRRIEDGELDGGFAHGSASIIPKPHMLSFASH